MSEVGRCQCSERCRMRAAPGQPFHLSHDRRPEMAEARRAAMSERGKKGGTRSAQARQRPTRDRCSLRSVGDLLAELERCLLLVEASASDSVQRANAITKIIGEAHSILRGDLEKQADRLTKLLEENPTLKRHLEAVK